MGAQQVSMFRVVPNVSCSERTQRRNRSIGLPEDLEQSIHKTPSVALAPMQRFRGHMGYHDQTTALCKVGHADDLAISTELEPVVIGVLDNVEVDDRCGFGRHTAETVSGPRSFPRSI
ncbi:MAG: hypothetical protein ACI81L_002119 [Verrucomicrobiales bacterium]|jgi:hypothetical protein